VRRQKDKKFRVSIVGTTTKNNLCIMEVTVIDKPCHIDHYFKFDVPADNMEKNVTLQNFLP
jgi:hypothetical protein